MKEKKKVVEVYVCVQSRQKNGMMSWRHSAPPMRRLSGGGVPPWYRSCLQAAVKLRRSGGDGSGHGSLSEGMAFNLSEKWTIFRQGFSRTSTVGKTEK